MLSYIGLFSKSFTLALILWPILSAVLTLPILAIMYHHDRRLRLSSGIAAYLAVLYALGLLAFTMYPLPDDPAQYCATHSLMPQLDIFKFIQDAQTGLDGILQLVMNVIFFLPMGYMLCRWARWKFWIAAIFSFGCSLFIETTQLTGVWGFYPCAYRQFDVDDMLTNTLGALIGYGIAAIMNHFWPRRHREEDGVNTHPGFVHRAVALIIDFIIMQLLVIIIGLGTAYLFYLIADPRGDGTFSLGTLIVGTELVEWIPRCAAVIAFIIFEIIIPWTHQGRTLGGSYTQMTCETEHRVGSYRVAFYCVRTAILGTWYLLLAFNEMRWWWPLSIALLVWWIFVHRMPWDLVPGTPKPLEAQVEDGKEIPVNDETPQLTAAEDAQGDAEQSGAAKSVKQN